LLFTPIFAPAAPTVPLDAIIEDLQDEDAQLKSQLAGLAQLVEDLSRQVQELRKANTESPTRTGQATDGARPSPETNTTTPSDNP